MSHTEPGDQWEVIDAYKPHTESTLSNATPATADTPPASCSSAQAKTTSSDCAPPVESVSAKAACSTEPTRPEAPRDGDDDDTIPVTARHTPSGGMVVLQPFDMNDTLQHRFSSDIGLASAKNKKRDKVYDRIDGDKMFNLSALWRKYQRFFRRVLLFFQRVFSRSSTTR